MSEGREAGWASRAVTKLVYTYAERLDAGDFEGLADLFSDATFRATYAGRTDVNRGSEEVHQVFQRLVRTYDDGTPRTKHVITNLIVEVDQGQLSASSRSYFSVLQGVANFPLQVIIAGRYHDSFACQDGHWRFTDRLIIPDLLGDQSRHLKVPVL